MSAFRLWVGAMERHRARPFFVDGTRLRGPTDWAAFRASAEGLSGMGLLRHVNRFWNEFPYVSDMVNWHLADYWACPREFVAKSGDCEDYAIAKYYTLRELGIAADDMRIFVVRDTLRRVPHAFLGVHVDGRVMVLDSISNAILPWERLGQYTPGYSVNEEAAWVWLHGRVIDRARKGKKAGGK